MKKLINDWEVNSKYSELNAIRFFDSCYILTNPKRNRTNNDSRLSDVKVIPIHKITHTNGISSINNEDFVNELSSELPEMELDNEELWKQI